MGHQTKLPVWLAGTKVMNDKYHSPRTGLVPVEPRSCSECSDTGLALPHSKTAASAPLGGRGWQQQTERSTRRGGLT
ncbi:unnamed protein product [Pleuronectes platessa]|uniref:Uncharacterized protein n=1 Tax=Pleuronectes platessa TaxID=8262 RepID=A0A9N7YD72_PLEPL|nr:unnamed protein product [Pleuronectes platessa]